MITEREVRAIIARLRAAKDGDTALLDQAADALEQMLPGFYLSSDSDSPSPYMDGWNSPAEALDPGEVRHLLPITTWDDCWAARRGDAVECFPTMEQAEAWAQPEDEEEADA